VWSEQPNDARSIAIACDRLRKVLDHSNLALRLQRGSSIPITRKPFAPPGLRPVMAAFIFMALAARAFAVSKALAGPTARPVAAKARVAEMAKAEVLREMIVTTGLQ
jgi:hypothetical protein